MGGLLPCFAPIPSDRMDRLASRIKKLAETARYLVPSHDPSDPRFDGRRYWRGPAWLIVNYMIADGLVSAGQVEVAERIEADSLRLIEKGVAEYYEPISGEPCGGGHFTWTAAIAVELLTNTRRAA